MIHVVFQTADAEVLNKVIELDASLSGAVFEIKDDFAVGPLRDLDTEEGWSARQEWWSAQLEASPYGKDNLAGRFDDRITVNQIRSTLEHEPDEVLWIWMAQNQHDVSGYYWLMPQLKDFQGRVAILYFNNLPFINDKGQIFYPTNLHDIRPAEFLKAKKLNRLITSGEFEVDPDEWKRLVEENAMVRILEGGKKIVAAPETFFDKNIMAALTKDWQKASRVFQNLLGKMPVKTGDVFLLSQMHRLASAGELEINGDVRKSFKDFEIRIASQEAPAVNEASTDTISNS